MNTSLYWHPNASHSIFESALSDMAFVELHLSYCRDASGFRMMNFAWILAFGESFCSLPNLFALCTIFCLNPTSTLSKAVDF